MDIFDNYPGREDEWDYNGERAAAKFTEAITEAYYAGKAPLEDIAYFVDQELGEVKKH